MQNFSFLAGLEVTEKFVQGGWFQVTTVSNLHRRLEFLYVELS